MNDEHEKNELRIDLKKNFNAFRLMRYESVIADAEVVWCQEEPMNMGAYNYISPRLCTAIRELGRGPVEAVKYAGRPPSAATATGFLGIHQREQKELVQKAIGPDPVTFPL